MDSVISPPLDSDSKQPIFSGGESEDVCNFIRRVQQIGFSQGRTRNDDWHADYATTCLAGAAMRWYYELGDETCITWIHLRRALTLRFPSRPRFNLPETVPPASIPATFVSTAVDAPRQGRIGLIDNDSLVGYMPKDINGSVWYNGGLPGVSDKPLIVEAPNQGAEISAWKMRVVVSMTPSNPDRPSLL
ncbi:hypothetical protein FRB94_012939 [Tulasnella sp. JGI-2019a]|nr:hypothetical protein FRB94_012939 [Tulasnella sp. JGI-2019a]